MKAIVTWIGMGSFMITAFSSKNDNSATNRDTLNKVEKQVPVKTAEKKTITSGEIVIEKDFLYTSIH